MSDCTAVFANNGTYCTLCFRMSGFVPACNRWLNARPRFAPTLLPIGTTQYNAMQCDAMQCNAMQFGQKKVGLMGQQKVKFNSVEQQALITPNTLSSFIRIRIRIRYD